MNYILQETCHYEQYLNQKSNNNYLFFLKHKVLPLCLNKYIRRHHSYFPRHKPTKVFPVNGQEWKTNTKEYQDQ